MRETPPHDALKPVARKVLISLHRNGRGEIRAAMASGDKLIMVALLAAPAFVSSACVG